jgi:hypothetical protein
MHQDDFTKANHSTFDFAMTAFTSRETAKRRGSLIPSW